MSNIYISKAVFSTFNKFNLWEFSLKLWRNNGNPQVNPQTVYLNLLITIKNFLLSKRIILQKCPLQKLCVYTNNINYINYLIQEVLNNPIR
jgi:hypothetical protein